MIDPRVDFRTFADRDALAEQVSRGLASALAEEIAANGAATLAVSGGSTPGKLFRALSAAEIDWSAVVVTLVDERWVPETHDRSNARLVRETLLRNAASKAKFLPLHLDATAPEGALAEVQQRLAALPGPITIALLGMGDDGHTASFFPGGDRLLDAIDPTGKALVMSMRAAAAIEPRITLTLPALLSAKKLALHIEGETKKAVLERALAGDDATEMPIRAVIANAPEPLEVLWAP